MVSTDDVIVILVGCNYPKTSAALSGCANDVKSMWKLLSAHCGAIDATVLVDDDVAAVVSDVCCKGGNVAPPTRANIFGAWAGAVESAHASVKAGRRPLVFFHFSGHGGSTIDVSGDEADRKDETILPTDFRTAGVIVDDDLNREFLKKMPTEAHCFLFLDECHSGSAADLCYRYDPARGVTVREGTDDVSCRAMAISGCMDAQTSADAFIKSKFQGATTAGATALFPTLLMGSTSCTVGAVGKAMHDFMRNGRYAQRPQITASFPIDQNTRFLLAEFFRHGDHK